MIRPSKVIVDHETGEQALTPMTPEKQAIRSLAEDRADCLMKALKIEDLKMKEQMDRAWIIAK